MSLESSWGKVVIGGLLLVMAGVAAADILFADGFETGNLSSTQNQVRWIDSQSTAVSPDIAHAGKYALKFTFTAGGAGVDAFAEQRISLPRKSEYWFKYTLYVPNNYVHRLDDYNNNKFLAVYQAPYLKINPGFQVNFSLQANGRGGSDLEVHHYNAGIEGPVSIVSRDFVTELDRGKWMSLIAQVKVPTSATSRDGIMRMWKNDKLVVDIANMPSWGGTNGNYIDQAYFLGWSNSGFTETTLMYIDDVIIADSPLSGVIPNPPTDVKAQ